MPILLLVLLYLAVIVLTIAGLWGVFAKAGQPGWAAIVPIYNAYIMVKIIDKPIWWFIMLFIPCISIVFCILVWVEICKRFGKGGGYVVGIMLLPFIFIPMLGLGNAQYMPTTPAQPPPPARPPQV